MSDSEAWPQAKAKAAWVPGRLAATSKFSATRHGLRQNQTRHDFSGRFLYFSYVEYENLFQLKTFALVINWNRYRQYVVNVGEISFIDFMHNRRLSFISPFA